MSKRITTRWYIGAWLVWVLALVWLVAAVQSAHAGTSRAPAPAALGAYLVMAVAALVMLVMWIGALVRLVQQRTWGWFAVVSLLHLIGLGITGMVAYAIVGPEDLTEVAFRPRSVD